MSDGSQPPKLLVLPSFLATKGEVHKMLTELLQIEKFLDEAKMRQPGTKLSLPQTTADLDKFADANGRNVLNHDHRGEMARFLRAVYKYAPEIAVMVSPNAEKQLIDKIIEWFRQNVHAQTLISRSDQARLNGGAIIRIKHKSYDFSLNSRLAIADSVLASGLSGQKEPVAQNPARSSYF